MKVKFIKHSCYSIEGEKYFLVFDYIGGNLNFPKDKEVIFFVSHRHADHFDPNIFKLPADFYIISDDVKAEKNENIKFIGQDQEFIYKDLRIITHGSTDEGVSFYVQLDNKGIIHMGDLNYWIWPRYTKEDINHMDKWFKSEIDKFKIEKTHAIIFPVDPRLEENYDLTAKYIFETIDAKHFFPMHMWEKYKISDKLKNKYQNILKDKIIHSIRAEDDLFEI